MLGVAVLAMFSGFAVAIVFAVLFVSVHRPAEVHNAGSAIAQLLTGALELPIAFVVLFFLERLAGKPLSSLGYRSLRVRDIAPIVVAVFAVFACDLVWQVILKVLHQAPRPQAGFEHVSFVVQADAVTTFIVLCFVVPFAEETFFRAFLFNAFAAWMPVWTAAIASALLFVAAHGDLHYSGPIFTLAIVGTALYRRTGNIYASMILHGLNNGVAFADFLSRSRHVS